MSEERKPRAFETEDVTIPHEVVMRSVDVSLIRAWREHLGLSQSDVAARMGISPPAYQKLEDKGAHPRLQRSKKLRLRSIWMCGRFIPDRPAAGALALWI